MSAAIPFSPAPKTTVTDAPNFGINKNPATRLPNIAPKRSEEYTSPIISFFSILNIEPARGKIAPKNIVGTRSI